jgi:catechol 2,3-dioxygenase-like lactoylglutathione lyase family enzyme
MFSHIMIGTNDLDRAKSFYDALLGTLGVPPAFVDGHRIFYMTPTGIFSVSKPINGEPATAPNGGTIGFACASPEVADAWHAAGLAAGGTTCEDPPGVRAGSHGQDVSRLSARPGRQQALRHPPDGLIARPVVDPAPGGVCGGWGLKRPCSR